jgi:hypothetical protein
MDDLRRVKTGSRAASRFRRWSIVHITTWAMRKRTPAVMGSQPHAGAKGAAGGPGEGRSDRPDFRARMRPSEPARHRDSTSWLCFCLATSPEGSSRLCIGAGGGV